MKLDMSPKYTNNPALCPYDKNYFPNAQFDLLCIPTPRLTPGHDAGTTLAKRWRFMSWLVAT